MNLFEITEPAQRQLISVHTAQLTSSLKRETCRVKRLLSRFYISNMRVID